MAQKNVRKIAFNIFASSDEEAERGRTAIVQFINLMCCHGAMVSGEKLSVAMENLKGNTFVTKQIVNFLKQ